MNEKPNTFGTGRGGDVYRKRRQESATRCRQQRALLLLALLVASVADMGPPRLRGKKCNRASIGQVFEISDNSGKRKGRRTAY